MRRGAGWQAPVVTGFGQFTRCQPASPTQAIVVIHSTVDVHADCVGVFPLDASCWV